MLLLNHARIGACILLAACLAVAGCTRKPEERLLTKKGIVKSVSLSQRRLRNHEPTRVAAELKL